MIRFRIFSSGAPRRVAIETLAAAKSLGWDADFHWFKLFTADPVNELFAETRQTDADFGLFICDDVGLTASELERLPAHDKPVVDSLLPVWNQVMYWNCYHVTPDDILFSVQRHQLAPLEQVYQTAVATACYRRDVIDAIECPFTVQTNPDGTLRDQGGSDVSFCRELQRRNIPLWVDTTLHPRHQRPVELDRLQLPHGVVRKDVSHLNLPRADSYQEQWAAGNIRIPEEI